MVLVGSAAVAVPYLSHLIDRLTYHTDGVSASGARLKLVAFDALCCGDVDVSRRASLRRWE